MKVSKFSALLRYYPNRIAIEGGTRVRCQDIVGTEEAQVSDTLKEIVARQVRESQQRLDDRIQEREQRLAEAGEKEESLPLVDEPDDQDSGWLESGQKMRQYEAANVSVDDIEFREITGSSRILVEPYPRAFQCPCDHLDYLSPEVASGESSGRSCSCNSCSRDGLDLFPYVFVCPRCSHIEQIAPSGLHVDHRHEGVLRCPECEEGHIHQVGDLNDVGNAEFRAVGCAGSENHGPWKLEGDCPECDFPGTNRGDEEASKLIPASVDSNISRTRLVNNLTRVGADGYEAFKRRGDRGDGDRLDWNLEQELSRPSQLLYRDLGVESAFSLNDVELSNVAFGYVSTTSRRGSPIEERDKLVRPFDPEDAVNAARAFLVEENGRSVFVKFVPERLLGVVPDTNEESTIEEVARQELRLLSRAAPGPFDDLDLALVPTLHSLQHAMFETAREMAGLEEFLGSKMFATAGAISLIEKDNVGMGGLTQLIIERDGSVFIDFLEEVEAKLSSCDRDCDSACPACNYIEDSHCHPFQSREVEEYVPANSLLDRVRAHRVMTNA